MATPAQRKLAQKRLADIRKTNNIWFKRLKWTGFTEKTLWDWLQLLSQVLGAIAIPLAIAIGTTYFSAQQNQTSLVTGKQQHQIDLQIANDQQREVVLQTYLDNISGLLLNDKLLQSQAGDPVRELARIQTLTTLRRLDPAHKVILLQFLYEAKLIGGITLSSGINQSSHVFPPVISLNGADLSNVVLSDTVLSDADLSGTNLTSANLSRAILKDAYLRNANLRSTNLRFADLSDAVLRFADLSDAVLSDANLSDADLSGAILNHATLSFATLSDANLSDADLSRANLIGVTITSEQLAKIISLKGATMPDGSQHL